MADDYSTDQFKATQMFDEIVWHLRSNLVVRTNRKDLVMTADNSFTGKDALDFLLVEVPRIVPGKVPTRENMEKLLEMMIEWKIIAEAFPKKTSQKRKFSETRIYVFAKSLDELKKPKPRSRRSASFSGGRKNSRVAKNSSPAAATLNRAPKPKAVRRLSRSNGNVDKAGVEAEPAPSTSKNPHIGGVENHGFEDHVEYFPTEPVIKRVPKILNRSLESVCRGPEDPEPKKEKVYDWLPFFKSKRFAAKASARRSVSLDRNHCIVEQERLAEKEREKKVTTPPQRPENNLVYLQPKGPLPTAPPRYQSHRTSIVQTNSIPLVRGTRMYESIMRRSSVAPIIPEPPPPRDTSQIWKTELLARLEFLYDRHVPSDFASKIDGADIQWNIQELDAIDGVVKSRSPASHAEYPTSIVQFMEYLGRYPFSATKKNELVHEHSVSRMFSTLVNRLEDLNAPLYSDECALLISLLSKTDNFAMMLETGAGRRWSRVMPSMSGSNLEEPGLLADGFIRELPVGSVRASRHRRRALSPYDNRIRLDIQDEKAYKVREPWLVEAIQLVLLSLPSARRRKLHKFLLFIKSVATNEVFDIADPSNGSSNNREAAIIGLWTGVCGGFRKLPGMLLTAVLLANYRTLFSIPEDFVEKVHLMEHRDVHDGARYEKLIRGRRGRKTSMAPEVLTPILQPTEKAKKGLLNRLLRK